jgi:quinol monooxygenase YgiN
MPGCIRFELHRSRTDPQRFLLYQLYTDHAALEHHRQDALFKVWRPRIAALEASRRLEEYDTLIARPG